MPLPFYTLRQPANFLHALPTSTQTITMKLPSHFRLPLVVLAVTGVAVSVAAFLTACGSSPMTASSPSLPSSPQPSASPATPPKAPAGTAPQNAGPAVAPTAPAGPPAASRATTPKDYRRDAAGHLYVRNANRIFKGKLPPHLYAIGVFEVEVDGRGRVVSTHWLRAPKHAPEVIAEVERTVREAQPYPVPSRMGRVVYTDTWLWHVSGQFQLDTLTEGQL